MSKSCTKKFKEHTTFVTASDGVQLFCRFRGPKDGPAVIFVPGFNVPSPIWQCVQKFLASNGFFTVASDFRGEGNSGKPAPAPGVYVFQRYVQDQRDIAQAFGLKRPVAVGYSAGVEISLAWAIQFPGELKKVVTVAGSPAELDPLIG